MSISLKHKFASLIPDAGDPTIVQPSNWNDEHALTQATSTILGRVTAGTGVTEELTPAQARTLLNVADGATANSSDAFLLARANHTGTESADVLTDGTTNKAFLATERTKLAGIAAGATANSTDAFLLARANHTGTQLAATISDFSTAADLRIAAAAATGTGSLVRANNATVSGTFTLGQDPATALEAATKQYVDNLAAGLDVKPSARAATTANITLSAPQTIDGVSVIAGDRVLVKDQATPAQNGIYVVAAGAWARATDMDAWTEVPGANVWVEEGTANADRAWVCSANAGGTIGTTAITWSQFGGTGAYQAASANLTSWAAITRAAAVDTFANSGLLPIANGGTGQTTAAAAFDALAPTTTRGDLIFRNATTNARLAASTAGYLLQTNGAGTDPTYAGFLQVGTGGVVRTWQAKAAERFSVKDFGAVGDGVTNDTTAVAAALAAVPTQGSLYFPAGTYLLTSSTLARTLSAGQSFKISGDGPDATILYFPNNGDGIALTYTANSFAWLGGNNVIVEDLSFVTNVQNTGRAISVIGASTIGNPNRPTVFNRVGFRGTVNNSSYWTNGIYISDTQNVVVNDCYYYSYATGLLGTGIFYTGTTNAAHPTVLNVHNFNMQFGATGIQCTGYVEGLNVTQSNITQVANGIVFTGTVALPQCSVTNTQIYASTAAISSNATASQLTGNLIFLSGGFAIVASGAYGTITGNTIVGVSGTPNGILLQSGGTNNHIDGNVFKGLSTNIWLQSGANNNTIGINQHADGTPMLDQGSGNTSGSVPIVQFATVAGSDVALTNSITTAQNIFAAANDTMTVAPLRTFEFYAKLFIATGATTHTTAFGFALGGGATLTSILYASKLWSGTLGVINSAAPQTLDVTSASATVLCATSTATGTIIELQGIIRVNVGGTITPQITFSAGPTGTCAVKVNSIFKIWDIGSNAVAAAGPWA